MPFSSVVSLDPAVRRHLGKADDLGEGGHHVRPIGVLVHGGVGAEVPSRKRGYAESVRSPPAARASTVPPATPMNRTSAKDDPHVVRRRVRDQYGTKLMGVFPGRSRGWNLESERDGSRSTPVPDQLAHGTTVTSGPASRQGAGHIGRWWQHERTAGASTRIPDCFPARGSGDQNVNGDTFPFRG